MKIITEFARNIGSAGSIHNGYLYYTDEKTQFGRLQRREKTYRGLARKKIDATIDDPEEIVYEKSAMEQFGDGVVYIQERKLGRLRDLSSRIIALDLDTLETTVAFEYTQNDEDLIELQVVYGDEWVVNVLKYEDGVYTGSYAYAYYNSKSVVWQEFDLS